MTIQKLVDKIYDNLVAGRESFMVNADIVLSPLKETTKAKFSDACLLVEANLLPDVFVETAMDVEIDIMQSINALGKSDCPKKIEYACFTIDDFKNADVTKSLIERSLVKLTGRMELQEYMADMTYEKFKEGVPDFLTQNRFSCVEIPVPEVIAEKVLKGRRNDNSNPYHASLYISSTDKILSATMRDKGGVVLMPCLFNSPDVYEKYQSFFRQARNERLLEALEAIGADALVDKMYRAGTDRVFFYADISVIIDAMIDNGLLHTEMVSGVERIAVYRAATKDSPAGWYLSQYDKVVDELRQDEEGVRYCVGRLEEKCKDLGLDDMEEERE